MSLSLLNKCSSYKQQAQLLLNHLLSTPIQALFIILSLKKRVIAYRQVYPSFTIARIRSAINQITINKIANAQSNLPSTQVQLYERKEPTRRSSTIPKSQVCNRADQSCRFYLGSGNNSDLVRRVLSSRKNWSEVESRKQSFINLRWQQSSKSYKYESCIGNSIFRQCLNHLEYHQELSNKEYLFKNVYEYCETHKINVFSFVPLTFVLNVVDSAFQQEQTFFVNFYNNNKPRQAELIEHVHLRRRRFNPNHLIFFTHKADGNYCKFQISPPFKSQDSPYLWILKPTFYNRGNGVHVFGNLAEMQNLMNKYMQGVSAGPTADPCKPMLDTVVRKSFRIRQLKDTNLFVIRSNSFVVQKYMQRPLLFAGRKFDIRMWVLFTHELKVYIFREGYLRTSSYQFGLNAEKLADLNVHLTNNAVQKHNQDYGKYELGNQLSFEHLRQLVEGRGRDFGQLIAKIKEIVKITALSVRKKINKHERSYCFQIFGYDFMIDQECDPWLIQVNTNPCIEESSPVLQELLPRMLDNAFALTIDQIFEMQPKNKVVYPVSRAADDQNLWEFVVDIKRPI